MLNLTIPHRSVWGCGCVGVWGPPVNPRYVSTPVLPEGRSLLALQQIVIALAIDASVRGSHRNPVSMSSASVVSRSFGRRGLRPSGEHHPQSLWRARLRRTVWVTRPQVALLKQTERGCWLGQPETGPRTFWRTFSRKLAGELRSTSPACREHLPIRSRTTGSRHMCRRLTGL